MIGGYDLTSSVPHVPGLAVMVVAVVNAQWPHAVFETVEDDISRPLVDLHRGENFLGNGEVFIYQDSAAYRSWSTDGGTEENAGTMLHVLVDNQGVTLVTDAPGTRLTFMAEAIMKNLEAPRLQSLDRLPEMAKAA